jgi:hypothetical protein
MAKIKITDLPKDVKVSEDDLKKIRGGFQVRGTLAGLGGGAIGSAGQRINQLGTPNIGKPWGNIAL